MTDTYIQLVNKLRNRFNEVALTTGTWSSTIGFDQFTKEAINYAYHDMLNAEMQWPFLHQSGTFKTTPGIQFYTPTLAAPTGFTSPAELKQIDYESFYISNNDTRTTISNEVQTVGATSPYYVTPTNIASWQSDLGVIYSASSIALTPTTGNAAAGQYTIKDGLYYFNSSDAGVAVKISYITQTAATQPNIINAQHLDHMDYDLWRQTRLFTDLDPLQATQTIPDSVFKTNNLTEIGLTPVPDAIYSITYEYWIDGLDLSATTDVPLSPSHYNQILIDGAQKYCYEFREDPQLATMASKRFDAGIARMRIELINRRNDMKTGFRWPRGTYSFAAANTVR